MIWLVTQNNDEEVDGIFGPFLNDISAESWAKAFVKQYGGKVTEIVVIGTPEFEDGEPIV